MLDSLFLFQVVLSFIISGSFAVFALWAAEKSGTKLGSIIISLPSTSAFGLLFISLIQGTDASTQAAVATTASLAGAFVFVFLFVKLLDKFGIISLFLALIGWFFIASLIPVLNLNIYSAFMFSFLFFVPIFILLKKIKPEKTKIKSNLKNNLFRFIMVGTIVSLIVLISKLISPFWGGIFSAFPAMYLSTFYIAFRDYEPEFCKAIAANMIYAFLGFMSYSASIFFLYPLYGIVTGTIISYLIYFIVVYTFNLLFGR